MGEFIYNKSKNASMGHIFLKLNCGYHPQVSFKDKCNADYGSSSVKRLVIELKELMNVCCQNLLHAQDLQKRAHDKDVKPWSYALGENIWLNSKHIKTKRNRKLEAKFFEPFQVLHSVKKQTYKLELIAKWKI